MDPSLRALISRAVQHQQRGEHAQAEQLYLQALGIDPKQIDALQFMGMLTYQTERPELAESYFLKALSLAPQRPDFHFNYAKALIDLGRLEEAAQELQSTVDIAPDTTDAWQALGAVLHSLQHDMHAVVCFQRTVALEPGRSDAWLALGECLQGLNLTPEAIAAFRHGLSISPSEPRLHLALLISLMELRVDAEVEAALARLTALTPDMPELHYNRGVWLANKGDFPAARSALQRAIALAPDYYQAILYYAYITPLPPDDPLVRRLLGVASQHDWREPSQGANVHFTLGYVLDKDKQYDLAFRHHLEANRLQRQSHHYSTASQKSLQDSMQAVFGDPGFLGRASKFGNPSSKPIFIVGMPRSGTSLLEQILSSHPAVHGGGEMTFLQAEFRRRIGPALQNDFAGTISGLPDAELAGIAASLVEHLDRIAPGAARVTDKLPANFMMLGLLHALFPNARIIHCRRDPLDTCVSCFTTSFRQGQKFTNDLTELGEYYRLYMEAMDYWRGVLPAANLYEVTYETLVGDMESEVRKLLDFCGLEWDAACLHFEENPRAVSTASVYQVRQPVYNSAIGRWRRYATHLRPLQEALGLPHLI